MSQKRRSWPLSPPSSSPPLEVVGPSSLSRSHTDSVKGSVWNRCVTTLPPTGAHHYTNSSVLGPTIYLFISQRTGISCNIRYAGVGCQGRYNYFGWFGEVKECRDKDNVERTSSNVLLSSLLSSSLISTPPSRKWPSKGDRGEAAMDVSEWISSNIHIFPRIRNSLLIRKSQQEKVKGK